MEPSKLDRRITIQRKTSTQNALGEDVEMWADMATVFAAKRDVSDGERVAAAEVSATITTRFQIHWSPTVKGIAPGDHRVVYDARTYDITAVKEIDRRKGLEITAAARAE